MDIDIKEVSVFCEKLQGIYDSLAGEAKLQEPFGNKQYISFSANKTGHIFVSGVLNSNGANGLFQELKFENSLDQTFLKTFIFSLKEFSSRF